MPDRPTEADLARWEALADQATPGPWRVGHPWSAEEYWHYLCSEASKAYIIGPYDVDEGGIASTPDDAAFLAASRTAVPALVDEVRRLRGVLTRIADGDGYGSATECWCWDIAADALRLEGPDA